MDLGRLTKRKDIQLVLSKGRHFPFRAFRVKFLRRPQSELRIAIIVSKKVSKKAVERNRIRRRFREALRVHRSRFGVSGDLAAFPSNELLTISFAELGQEMLKLAKKI